VSGCSVREVLRASHIKPWKPSTDRERLDGHNGLLLTADLDALFDRGLISFDDDGEMLVSARLTEFDRKLFQLQRKLRKAPTKTQCRYLSDHRRRWAFQN
jgi:predicted restriction endonuclease